MVERERLVPTGVDRSAESPDASRTIAADASADEIRAAVLDALESAELREGAARMAKIVATYGRGERAVHELEALLSG